ncbi:OCIA domain-containing protein 1 [Triplophysa rosa]|uniref:OCIA domain-containing protein 1 n=1 Tax=Triplophysa rosa TaxID=992332 RepID=A0A9W7WK52_TRIRA|nr:OCIA domain-containing protein 1 [Triplophysa rosa]
MSQASSGFIPAAQIPHGSGKGPAGAAYIPNEEERRVFRECNSESFWYRSLPFSAVAMAVAQVLVSRGVLTPSSRFGSLPKVATPPYPDEDVPKKKPVLYEDLRSKNRENYEVTITQKAETLLKPQAEVASPKREVKKTKYGDAWDE